MTTLCGHVTRSKIARQHPPEDVIKKDIIDGKEMGARTKRGATHFWQSFKSPSTIQTSGRAALHVQKRGFLS